MLVRPVHQNDVSQLLHLSQQGEKGMTTLPQSESQWLQLIERSQASFASLPQAPSDYAAFLLVLEEADGQLAGTSAVYTPLGYERPFYNYKITRVANVSRDYDLRVATDLLQLMNDYNGAAEVGTLLLRPEFRGGGRGKLLALARYMLIGAFLDAFPDTIIAEMRGWRDPDSDEIPFWEAVGRRFFNLSFDEADVLSGRNHHLIADLMPRIPIYTALLPEAAQAVIGRPHRDANPAYEMLRKQGFRFNNAVDIFDAGPCLEADKRDIFTVREMRPRCLGTALMTEPREKPQALVAATKPQQFVVAYAYGHSGLDAEQPVQASQGFYKHSGLAAGDSVQVAPLEMRQ